MNTANGLSHKGNETEFSKNFQFLPISVFSIIQDVQNYIEGLRMSLRPASPASPSPLPGKALAPMMNETAGRKRLSAFALSVPGESFWRTPQISLITNTLAIFSGAWPRSGILLSGTCFRRACSVRHKHGKDCSFWPTPTAAMSHHGWGFNANTIGRGRYRQTTIERCLQTGWKPCPEMLEAVMGWPIMWSDLKPLATGKYQSWYEMYSRH